MLKIKPCTLWFGSSRVGMVAKFVNALVNVGFERGEVDPCLIFWKNEYGVLVLILYFDDYLLTGDTLAIESGINNINKMFNITVTKKVEEYLGCRICQEGNILIGLSEYLIKIFLLVNFNLGELANKNIG